MSKTEPLKKPGIKPKGDELLIVPTKKLLKWYKHENGVNRAW